MDQRKLMLLGGAVGIALISAIALRSTMAHQAAPVVQAAIALAPKGPRVLVAQRALPVGTIITADAVAYQAWPSDLVRDAYFVDGKVNMDKLVGTVVRYPITAGQPLTQGQLVAPGDRGFLAAALGPGMRAITITVSEKSGVGGFVFPGDHVDLLLSSTVKMNNSAQVGIVKVTDDRELHATETILKNLRVLATDQATDSEVTNGKTVVRNSHTVTLEVTPKIAEKIEVAQYAGSLSLSLRPLADNQSDLDHAIASGQVKLPNGASKADEEKALANAMNHPADTRSPDSFVTGGDVSRFERKFGGSMNPSASPVQARARIHALIQSMAPPPSVRITRGHDTQSVTPDSGMAGAAGNFGNAVARGAGNAGNTMGPAITAGIQ